ncbi:MAG: electron transport complex subunit RsxE [Gammaproteobacteria bacterium]|nr:electron transport complex subunit RsxE [Gammaproteobacteria bacterium]
MTAQTSTSRNYRETFSSGIWSRNPGIAQLLGLCPLLAVSRTLLTGLALGIATLLVICATNVLVSATRRWIDPRVRLPALVLIIAAFVTSVDLLFKAWWFELYGEIGLFIPLIVTNCVILSRAEAFASRNPLLPALLDGLGHGIGFLLVLTVLGAVRELVGNGLLIASLPPGGFFALAGLIALRNFCLTREAAA